MKANLLPIIFCLLALSVFAQDKEAKKIYEFEDFGCEELKWRTFDFVENITKTPNSKGYVIIYQGKYRRYSDSSNFKYVLPRINEADTRTQLIKDQLLFLDYQPKNVIFIEGGIREKLTVEYFVVPKGAEVPQPTPTLKKIKYRKGKAPKISANFAAC